MIAVNVHSLKCIETEGPFALSRDAEGRVPQVYSYHYYFYSKDGSRLDVCLFGSSPELFTPKHVKEEEDELTPPA